MLAFALCIKGAKVFLNSSSHEYSCFEVFKKVKLKFKFLKCNKKDYFFINNNNLYFIIIINNNNNKSSSIHVISMKWRIVVYIL